MANGRINILHPDTTTLFSIYDRIPSKQNTGYRHPLEGLWTENNLSDKFFSAENVNYLQYMMIEGVLKMSNGQVHIGKQDEDQLKIIMRGVFLENAKNQNNNIQNQVNELNKLVLKYAVPQIYNAAIGYKRYLYDASTMYKPINPPMMTKNNKQLEFKKWF